MFWELFELLCLLCLMFFGVCVCVCVCVCMCVCDVLEWGEVVASQYNITTHHHNKPHTH